MNRFIAFLLFGLMMTACHKDNGSEMVSPICFEKNDYTVVFAKGAAIPFTGGGGIYQLSASDPDVLGRFGIDMETNNRLYIQPAKTGESTLTIVDEKAVSTVTLHITVVDFFVSFVVDQIVGENANPYISLDNEIRFVRDADNTKPIHIYSDQVQGVVAGGNFGISRTETNVYTMQMSLRAGQNEEPALYEYIMGGDGEYMHWFDNYFGIDQKSIALSRSQPVRRIEMILTDNANGCQITCVMQP